jgi:S-adenosylmethionine:tRNA ribosyltransferase-isomerase
VHAPAFELPPALEAHEPPEARGLPRDGVRLMVANRSDGSIIDAHFHDLPKLLNPGDLLVVNVSATLPAAIDAHVEHDLRPVRVHVSTHAPGLDDRWRVVEVRTPGGRRPLRLRPRTRLTLDGSAAVIELAAQYLSSSRLMLARWDVDAEEHLKRHGEPIRYGYVSRPWPLAKYQNVYATTPGSAEMPSAGRPFTPELITRLIARGVLIAPITLHCGVSSPERHEPPFPEFYDVPKTTARLIEHAPGRVIAVGTTVVRALESGGSGWTRLVIDATRGVRTVDGLITGWHEPQASHLALLEALAGPDLLAASYREALARGYLWHEFGDSHLII